MKKFLIINPFGIGDVLFTTPLVKAIKDNFPENVIGYWCNQRVEDILKYNKRIDKVFALSRGDIKKIYRSSKLKGIYQSLNLLHKLKKERFDIAFDFSLDHRYSLTCWISGIKKRIGFDYKNRGRFLTDKIAIDGYKTKHVVEHYLDLLYFVNIKPENYNLELNFSDKAKITAQSLLCFPDTGAKELIVGIAPGAGASWGRQASLKHWPAVRFAQVADKIAEEFKAKIVILGDDTEKPIADVIMASMQNRAINLVGKTSLNELSAVISILNLLITNDGGPLHMAVAFGIKTVSIFGPVDEKVYGPYPQSYSHIVIKEDLGCRPCYQNFRMPVCEHDRACIKSITVGKVFEAAKTLLRHSRA